MTLQAIQQLTGANYFFYYGATIFQSVGIQDSFITQIILGAVNFICTFGGIYLMENVSYPSPRSDAAQLLVIVRTQTAPNLWRNLASNLVVCLRGRGNSERPNREQGNGQT